MNEPIKTTDITGKPFWAIQEAFGKPLTAYQMAGMLNAAIKQGVVSLPKPSMTECLECLESWVIQHGCKCGHPVCDVCQETIIAEKVIEEAKGGAE